MKYFVLKFAISGKCGIVLQNAETSTYISSEIAHVDNSLSRSYMSGDTVSLALLS